MIKITIPWNTNYKLINDWLSTNCPTFHSSLIHMTENYKLDYNLIDYYFDNDADATLFALRWS